MKLTMFLFVVCFSFLGINCDDIEGLFQNEMLKLQDVDRREPRDKRESRDKRDIVSDAVSSEQWHLRPEMDMSMGVYEVWSRGITGKGIVIGIVDAGTDPTHTDLVDNYDAANSYDYVNRQTDASVENSYARIGVECAGLAVAANTSDCVNGVAHGATFVAIKVLEDGDLNDTKIAQGFSHGRGHVDIYSNSWGTPDDGVGIDVTDQMGAEATAALLDGVTTGRDGKGSIYVFSTGEGGVNSDDCNINGYVTSPYTIAIGSVDMFGEVGAAEECTSMLAVTFGGNWNQTVSTTTVNDGCTDSVYGAHAATPIAAGIIALMLEANNNLTWRDVQHLIVEHAQPIGDDSLYSTNGAGKRVSVTHGFGLMDASAMVTAAQSWNPVSELLDCTGMLESPNSYAAGAGNITNVTMIEGCNITSLEHVELYFYGVFYFRENTEIWLHSPSGTSSRLLRERTSDDVYTPFTWTFSSVHFWGENPNGTWTMETWSSFESNEIIIYEWQLKLRGSNPPPVTAETPQASIGVTIGLTTWSMVVVGLPSILVWF